MLLGSPSFDQPRDSMLHSRPEQNPLRDTGKAGDIFAEIYSEQDDKTLSQKEREASFANLEDSNLSSEAGEAKPEDAEKTEKIDPAETQTTDADMPDRNRTVEVPADDRDFPLLKEQSEEITGTEVASDLSISVQSVSKHGSNVPSDDAESEGTGHEGPASEGQASYPAELEAAFHARLGQIELTESAEGAPGNEHPAIHDDNAQISGEASMVAEATTRSLVNETPGVPTSPGTFAFAGVIPAGPTGQQSSAIDLPKHTMFPSATGGQIHLTPSEVLAAEPEFLAHPGDHVKSVTPEQISLKTPETWQMITSEAGLTANTSGVGNAPTPESALSLAMQNEVTAPGSNASNTSVQPASHHSIVPRVESVQAAARYAVDVFTTETGKTVEISLGPDELGRVRMSLVTSEAGVSIAITAERPETLELLRRHSDMLSQEFLRLGYEQTAFEFGEEEPGSDFSPDRETYMIQEDGNEAASANSYAQNLAQTGLDLRL